MNLLVATGNAGKLREIRRVLQGTGLTACGLADLDAAPEIVEDGHTFLDNARKKAWTLARAVGRPVLADDSGLVVDFLGGAPGVRSARFAGPDATDEDNNRLLLDRLRGVPPQQRTAAFVCAMVLAVPGRGEVSSEGRLEGTILDEPRGEGGFGYDPVFWVVARGASLAELPLDVKNRISHRGRALGLLRPVLLELARGGP